MGSLAGKEVHSRRVMKEGARAERGTVLFSLSCFSGPPNQIDQLPATRREMVPDTFPFLFLRQLDSQLKESRSKTSSTRPAPQRRF